MAKLHPHQEVWIEKIRNELRSKSSVLGEAPTGFGKSFVAGYIASGVIAKGKRVYFCVHRRALCLQTSREFKKNNIPHSFIASEMEYDGNSNVFVVMTQTLLNRLDKVPPPDLLIYDEAHTAKSEGGDKIIKWAKSNGAKVIGLTATPEPTDGSGLAKQFDALVNGPSMKWLIENGFLAPYELFCPEIIPDFSDVPVQMGDYVQEKVEEIINKPKITGDAIENYRLLADGKACVVFCNSVKHSHDVAEQFRQNGYKFVAIDSDTPDDERERVFAALANREIHGITNYGICIEGVDIPLVECVIIQRATKSIIVYLQSIGRAMRYMKGKVAIIIDQTGNVFRLGMPCMQREWSLEPKKKRSKGDNGSPMPLRHCKKCKAIYDAKNDKCPRCGSEHIIEHKLPKTKTGKLKKITPEEMELIIQERKNRKREEGMAQNYQQLVELAKKRGYNNPTGWAYMRLKGRGKI